MKENLLSQLQDIEGLGFINGWPLALGWWVLLGGFVLFLGGGVFLREYRKRRTDRWQHAILVQLETLDDTLSEQTAQMTLVELSELIRRIAIRQSSRTECAGLQGQAWLSWLTEHDPHQFNWKEQEKLLTYLPYAPQETPVPLEDLRAILRAIKGWVV